MVFSADRSEIVFFDLETTIPTRLSEGYAILEFGSISVCPKTLIELETFDTLVRPLDLSLISPLSIRSNGITADAVVSSPTFSEIADTVYGILHGRVWAGHNIVKFDCERLKEAYAQVNMPAPVPKGTIDTLPLLSTRFGTRAGNMKMASLAAYFKLGRQSHRSLDDVRMNLEVVKLCAAVLFLESAIQVEQAPIRPQNGNPRPNSIPSNAFEFIPTDEISMASITISAAPFIHGSPKIKILHRDSPLQIRCPHLRLRSGLSTEYVDHAGKPRLSFVVDANSSNLCNLLGACDNIAKKFVDSDTNTEWRPIVSRKPEIQDSPTIRLHLGIEAGDGTGWMTEICHKESSSSLSSSQLSSGWYDVAELDGLFRPGFVVDACLCLDPYYYQENAGIRLVAKKLILHN